MAEIEAFLRTGEAPPAAAEPEPVRSTSLPSTRPYEPGSMDVRAGGATAPHPAGVRGRLSEFRPIHFAGLRTWRRPAPAGSGGPLARAWAWFRRPIGGRRDPFVDRWGGGVAGDRLGRGGGAGRPAGADGLGADGLGADGLGADGFGAGGFGAGGFGADGLGGAGGLGRPQPAWTPARVVVVVAVLGALVAVPALYSSHSGGSPVSQVTTLPADASYTILATERSGAPVRWNPCAPIEYELDLAAAPASAARDIDIAMADVSQITGIPFTYAGSTTSFPSSPSPSSPGPVVIAWATPAQSAALDLATSAAGETADQLAEATPVALPGAADYVTGTILIGSAASQLPSGFVAGGLGVLMLHELGRLMGLGPVSTEGEVMNPDVLLTSQRSLGVGDRSGLQHLGRTSSCSA